MSLETFGWILVTVGVLLFVYGYLKASKRIEVEDLPRVTEQEKREAIRVIREQWERAHAGIDRELYVHTRPRVHDWEESGEL